MKSFLQKSKLYGQAVICLLLSINPGLTKAQDVDRLTGRAQISVPLGEISAGDISVPVSLWHHGNSLRVSEGEGTCGLGWNLSLNYSVGRSLRGLPDDYNVSGDSRKGWLQNSNAQNVQGFSASADDNLVVCTDETADYNFINGLGSVNDSEPDVFYFNAPGLSGKFVFDATGTPRLIPYQDVQIVPSKDASGTITQFTITSNQGMVYTFSVVQNETVSAPLWNNLWPDCYLRDFNYYHSNSLTYTSAWYLSSMHSKSSGLSANFGYAAGTMTGGNDYKTRILPNTSTQVDTLYYLSSWISPQYLQSVTIKGYSINIVWNNNLVSKVIISAGSGSKEYDMVYVSKFSNVWPEVHRQFLSEIKLQNNCITYPSFKFTYSGVDLTNYLQTFSFWSTGWQQDFFGFYNGLSTNKSVPTIYHYASETGARRFSIRPISGLTLTQTLAGSDRSVNASYNSFGALTRIDYPNGGATIYTYEPNKYLDPDTNAEQLGGGVRVQSITSQGGELAFGKLTNSPNQYHSITRSFTYTQTTGVTSGKLLYPPVFAFGTGTAIYRSLTSLGEAPEIVYARVTEIMSGKGSQTYEFSVPGVYSSITDGDWKATKTRTARLSCSGGTNLINGSYLFPFAPTTDYGFQRGLLTRKRELTETGNLVTEKRYTYSRIPGSATVIKGLRFELIGGAYQHGEYEILSGTSNMMVTEVDKIVGEENQSDSTKTTITYQYNSRNLPYTITATNDDGSIKKTVSTYAGDYAITTPPAGDASADAIAKLNSTNRTAELIEQIQKMTTVAGGSETVIGSQVTLYKDFGNGNPLPYQTFHFPPGATFTASSVGGNQSFIYDSDYLLSNTLEEYDANGNLINSLDYKKNRSSAHYSTDLLQPIASIYNAKAQQVVYEGFETTTGYGLTANFTPGYVAGWTGVNAAQLLSPTVTLSKTGVNKGSNTYRVSCWVNAAQTATVTFRAKNGSTVVTHTDLVYNPGSMGTWTYLEGTLDVTSLPDPFNLEVAVTNGTATVDDILALPQNARVSMNTYQPMAGVTSQSDDRGNSSVITYDALGRKVNTLDRKRNLVQVNEYTMQAQALPVIQAGFSYSPTPYDETPVTFTATGQSCVSVTYQWIVDGVVDASTSPTMTHTFAFGHHVVQLIVTNATYGSFTQSEDICVSGYTAPVSFDISISNGNTFHLCDIDNQEHQKTFTVSNFQGGGCASGTKQYVWSYTDANGNWVSIANSNSPSLVAFMSPNYSYYIKCDIAYTCTNTVSTCPFKNVTNSTTMVALQAIGNPCP